MRTVSPSQPSITSFHTTTMTLLSECCSSLSRLRRFFRPQSSSSGSGDPSSPAKDPSTATTSDASTPGDTTPETLSMPTLKS